MLVRRIQLLLLLLLRNFLSIVVNNSESIVRKGGEKSKWIPHSFADSKGIVRPRNICFHSDVCVFPPNLIPEDIFTTIQSSNNLPAKISTDRRGIFQNFTALTHVAIPTSDKKKKRPALKIPLLIWLLSGKF